MKTQATVLMAFFGFYSLSGFAESSLQVIDFNAASSQALASSLAGESVDGAECHLIAPALTLGERIVDKQSRIECSVAGSVISFSLAQEEWQYHGSKYFPRGLQFSGDTAKVMYELLEASYGSVNSETLSESVHELFDGTLLYEWHDFNLKQPMPVFIKGGQVVNMTRMSCGYESVGRPDVPKTPNYSCNFISSYDLPAER